MDEMEKKMVEELAKKRRRKPKNPGWQPEAMVWLLEQSGAQLRDIERTTGIKECTLTAYKTGRTCPNMGAAVKIADFFQVPLDFLVGRCSENETGEIFEHYADYFVKLRNASYNAYLFNKYAADCRPNQKYISGWPFNLVESIYLLYGPNESIEFNIDGLEKAVSTLSDREIELIRLRYKEEKTLKEIAESMDRSPEVVRQALEKALRKLRHPARSRLIRYGELGIERLKKLEERERIVEEKEKDLDAREKRLVEQELEAGIDNTEPVERNRMLETVEDMGLSTRPYNCLIRAGCKTVDDVCRKAVRGELMDIRNLGRRCCEEVLSVLREEYGVDCYNKYEFGQKSEGGIRW